MIFNKKELSKGELFLQLRFVKRLLADVLECRGKSQAIRFVAEFCIERNLCRINGCINRPVIFCSAVIQHDLCGRSPNFCIRRIGCNRIVGILSLLFVREVGRRTGSSRCANGARCGVTNDSPVTNMICFREVRFLQLHVGLRLKSPGID